MAIVIPVAVQALNIASRAGQVAVRKAEAARVADRLLNESLVTGSWSQSTQSGLITEQGHEFDWQLHNEAWSESPMRLISVEVEYVVQGKTYSVRLATLIDGSASLTPTTTTTTASTP